MFSPGDLSQSISDSSSVESVPSTSSGRSLNNLNFLIEGRPMIRLLRRGMSMITAVIVKTCFSELFLYRQTLS